MKTDKLIIEKLKKINEKLYEIINFYEKKLSNGEINSAFHLKQELFDLQPESGLEAEVPEQPVEMPADEQIIEYLHNKYYPVARSKIEAFNLIKGFISQLTNKG